MIQIEGDLVELRCVMCGKRSRITTATEAHSFAYAHDHHPGYTMLVRITAPADLAGEVEIEPVQERSKQ